MSGEYTEFLERSAEKDMKIIEAFTKALQDIAAWGEDNGAHWCRETALKALNGGNK